MDNKISKLSKLTLALALAGIGQVSLAQEQDDNNAPDKENEGIEVIMVSATKHASNLMKTPLAVSAMNPESLIRQNVRELSDLNGMIPNLQFGLSTADSGVQATIRGVSSTNFTEIGDPAVGIHIDGIYSPRPQGSLALMFDLEQVEVLRGPQGTTFGRNSTAGVINIIPAKPEFDENFGWVTAQLGNYNGRQLRGMYNLAITDNFAVRAAYMVDKRDGFINQVQDLTDRGVKLPADNEAGFVWTGPDGIPDVDMRLNRPVDRSDFYSNSDQHAMRLTALWEVNDDVDWYFGWEHYQNDSAGHVGLKDCDMAAGTDYACVTGDTFDEPTRINVPGLIDMTIDTFRTRVDWELDENTDVEYRFAYANQQRRQFHDDDSGYHRIDAEVDILQPWGNWGGQPIDDRATYTLGSEFKSWVHELQIKQAYEDFRYVAGLFWMKEDNEIRFAQNNLVAAPFGMPFGQYYHQPNREIDSKAIFAQADWGLTDTITATLGFRYSEDERSDNNGQTYGNWNAGEPWYYNGLHEPNFELGTGQPHTGEDLTFGMGAFAGPSAYPGPTVNTYSNDWSQTTYRVGLQYDPDRDNMFYFTLSTGYRPGGFGDRFDTCGGRECVDGSTEQFSYLDYDPELTTNYEIGYKGSLMDNKLNLSVVYFFTEYEDMHFTDMHAVGQNVPERECPDWNPACDIVNAWKTENIGNADIQGIEMEFDFIPWDNGRVTGFFSWLDSEITEYDTYNDNWICGYRDDFGAEPCADRYLGDDPRLRGRAILDVTGNQLPRTPEYSLGLNLSHYYDLGNGYELSPWLSWRWQDRMYFTPRNLDNPVIGDFQAAYSNWNASLKFAPVDGGWYVELWGTNLTDERVKNWMGQGATGGFTFNSYNPPRMYGVRVNMEF